MIISKYIISIFFACLGTLSICAAIANWDWFFNTNNGKIFVRLFKRTGARIFYIILGILIWIMAISIYIEKLILLEPVLINILKYIRNISFLSRNRCFHFY
ncbi:MAG: immunity 17 family protein [Coprobacter sp.]